MSFALITKLLLVGNDWSSMIWRKSVVQDSSRGQLYSVIILNLTGHFPTQWMALSWLATPLTAELALPRESTGSWNWFFHLYLWYIDHLAPSCHCQTCTIANLTFFFAPYDKSLKSIPDFTVFPFLMTIREWLNHMPRLDSSKRQSLFRAPSRNIHKRLLNKKLSWESSIKQ